MAMQNETGRIVIRFGLDEEGDEVYGWELEHVTPFEAWAAMQLVADRLHTLLQESLVDAEPEDA